jgi:hypothetical protein
MEENKYPITHVFVRSVEERGWVKTTYIVKRDEGYFIGELSNRPHNEKNLEKLIENKILIKLDSPVMKTENQCLWVTPNYEVYLASKTNPLGDNEKREYVCSIEKE